MYSPVTPSRKITAIQLLYFCSLVLVYCTSDEPQGNQANESNQVSGHQEVPELAEAMGTLQHFTHKYALAVEAENRELAVFYFHEIESTVDEIRENIPSYDGYDIRRFMTLLLGPAMKTAEESFVTRNWEDIREQTIHLVDA